MKTLARAVCIGLLLVATLIAPTQAMAATAVLSWGPVTSTGLKGYKVYQSTVSGQYSTPISVLGLVTTTTVNITQQKCTVRYYWVVTAYNAGAESFYSTEVSKTIPGKNRNC